jgi:hypothetical protein
MTPYYALLVFLYFMPNALSLELYNNNGTTSLSSRYTTLGGGPSATITSNVTLLIKDNITPDCKFQHINISTIIGTIFVYTDTDLPVLYKCCSDRNGNPTSFAQMMQRHGAVGIVVPSYQTVLPGHILFKYFIYSYAVYGRSCSWI